MPLNGVTNCGRVWRTGFGKRSSECHDHAVVFVYSRRGGEWGGGGALCNMLFSELSASVLLLPEANFIHRVACHVSIIHRVVVTSISFTV